MGLVLCSGALIIFHVIKYFSPLCSSGGSGRCSRSTKLTDWRIRIHCYTEPWHKYWASPGLMHFCFFIFPHFNRFLTFPCACGVCLCSSQSTSESCWRGPPSRTTCRSCTPCWASFSPASLQPMRWTTLSTRTPMYKVNPLLVWQCLLDCDDIESSSCDKVWIRFGTNLGFQRC